MEMTAFERKSKYEKCVVCHKKTTVTADTPVNLRKNYVRGVGELCDKCYLVVYCNIDPLNKNTY